MIEIFDKNTLVLQKKTKFTPDPDLVLRQNLKLTLHYNIYSGVNCGEKSKNKVNKRS